MLAPDLRCLIQLVDVFENARLVFTFTDSCEETSGISAGAEPIKLPSKAPNTPEDASESDLVGV